MRPRPHARVPARTRRRVPVAAAALAFALALALAGCAPAPEPPTLTLAPGAFEIRVPARGELRAEKTTPIPIPTTLRGPQTISWLAEEGAVVRAGELVARLDGRPMGIQEAEARREVDKLDLSIGAQRKDHVREKKELVTQIELLHEEKRIAEHFAPKDEEIYSRNEIIDSQVSLELLETKTGLYEGKRKRQDRKHSTDAQLLALQRQTQEVRVDQAAQALASLELLAPHDGIFVRRRRWRGDPIVVGSTVWGSESIGELPDLARMEARVQVLESEAPGLAPGLEAEVRLDAAPERLFKAKVKTVGAVAAPIEDESPVKYFEVILTLDTTAPELMRPGQQVAATIYIARKDGVLAVPNQALFHKGDENWVFVRDGGGWVRRPVELGSRSLTRTVIEKGLEPGEVVALADPDRV